MTKVLTIIIAILTAQCAYAESFDIGGKDITVPTPQGFSRVTPDMHAAYRFSQQMVDPRNDLLAIYILDSEVAAATAGELPAMDRYILLKVNKQIKNMVVGSQDFAELKAVTIRQNEQIVEEAMSLAQEMMAETGERVSEEFDVDLALQISEVVPLEPHYETENALAYSMYVNVGVMTEGTEEVTTISGTNTFVNVAGKVLFLYCYGLEDELEWTRSASQAWAEAVMSSNVEPPEESSGGQGFDWGSVAEKTVIGAVIGAVIALVASLRSKSRKKK